MTFECDPPFDTATEVYRRRIRVTDRGDGVVECGLEDDFHHFVVRVGHDATHVRTVAMDAHRWPWTTCPEAGRALDALADMPLSPRVTAAGDWTNPALACTHQFDAAVHAITHAAGRVAGTRAPVRQYDCEIGAHFGQPDGPSGRNRLWVDGEFTFEWYVTVGVGIIDPPAPFHDAPWRGGFMRWADTHFDPETAERAIVLRRACDIGMGHGMPLDDIPEASQLLDRMAGVCYTMQPTIAIGSRRHVGNIQDFTTRPGDLLS